MPILISGVVCRVYNFSACYHKIEPADRMWTNLYNQGVRGLSGELEVLVERGDATDSGGVDGSPQLNVIICFDPPHSRPAQHNWATAGENWSLPQV